MKYEECIKKANEVLEKLNQNNEELSLDECVKIYKEGLKSIKTAREILQNAKLEVENIDE
ncbi:MULTISPECIES: exodeoxyribonuclease VII small subunit [unclassified Campylobacter]|uniref:exodeoxyribonuclease VII small subunit n=1 Tax=unclassified Campylobacter TaxID=2593542 RepID=UPI001237F5C6|nr:MULTISPECIES: exodeoxyribonuclease VII small subunit [unclassified Campylobacter]KAA6224652.1 exodeoxyribonuclease VII small subunit [Campylobacter sp. LR185c]KAA6225652.1 exodeoxyribonuclease VII small subunit [Campylobacter sp. LR286c]KAA6225771.1 exodeoxyribonuclease VII small subunit [Campylobacter sp. LR196d]KAA6229625.1 exodeoxyribonuclease VII small subunit [Campylobacter sp. LR291e]KAA6230130.1 exodeoxyribonuclease VII small subunit [Campylobacter sp. LR264d]